MKLGIKFGMFEKVDRILLAIITMLVAVSIVVLNSITVALFPTYFIFLFVGFVILFLFVKIDFDIFIAFSKILYIFSILFLLIPLIIGQVTRGAIRWIPIGNFTLQPSELVRPFLILFFASYMTEKELDLNRLVKSAFLLSIPLVLIFIQPSLGVSILTAIGFIGVVFASTVKKRYLLVGALLFVVIVPVAYQLLASYQKQRIQSFINPSLDPTGAGYNSIQSMISVGAGKIFGRGLGKGVQTQLAFLPEKHTDFIFAATTEELGFLGATILLILIFLFLLRISKIAEVSGGPTERAFISGAFLVLFVESVIHIGMNMGLVPITGVPLPLVSAGGSSFIATMITVAMIMNAKKPAP
jgi:rod shape determining protein RodA